jgi:hemoglobin/transferrin/lactoferrin receptor protein
MNKKVYAFAISIICVCTNAIAQDIIVNKMESVTVTAYRFAENINKIPFTTKKITNKGWNMQAPTTAEVLVNSGEVFVQKSQAGGGSPVIRGFEASRVLIMVDGVRLNNAIYRSGHLQNAITVDANILNNIDILFGPSSTQFGSDALGGVVSMFTKNAVLSNSNKTKITGNIGSRFSSALNELQMHSDINIGTKKWGFLTSITTSSFGDVMQGKNRKSRYPDFGKKRFYINTVTGEDYLLVNNNFNKQIATAYNQFDFLQKIKFAPNEKEEHILNMQYSTSTAIPRYDRLTELNGLLPKFAEWYYGPQKRLLLSHQYNATLKNNFFNKIQSTIAFQNIRESRYDRRFGNKNLNNRIEKVNVLSYSLDGLHKKGKNENHIGIDVQLNEVTSIAFSKNIVTNVAQNNITSRYPNGKNKMNYVAAYYQHLYSVNKQTTINAGARITQVNLKSTFKDNTITQFPFDAIQQKNTAITGNLGIIYNTTNQWKLASVFSTGYRAPNIDDVTKIFDSRAGAVIVPNPNLKPETTYNIEINAAKYSGNIQGGAAVFYTAFRNAIVVDAFTFNGQSSIVYQGVNSTVLASQNKSKAYLYGASAFAKIKITAATEVYTTATYTVGKVVTPSATPLDHIPPTFGKIGIKHQQKIWNAELYSLFNGWKRIKNYSNSGEDNQQYATVDGMPSWYTINLHTQVNLSKKLQLLFGMDNILDRNYRVFASGISAPGRNIIIALKSNF